MDDFRVKVIELNDQGGTFVKMVLKLESSTCIGINLVDDESVIKYMGQFCPSKKELGQPIISCWKDLKINLVTGDLKFEINATDDILVTIPFGIRHFGLKKYKVLLKKMDEIRAKAICKTNLELLKRQASVLAEDISTIKECNAKDLEYLLRELNENISTVEGEISSTQPKIYPKSSFESMFALEKELSRLGKEVSKIAGYVDEIAKTLLFHKQETKRELAVTT